jgi:hypothetical protein
VQSGGELSDLEQMDYRNPVTTFNLPGGEPEHARRRLFTLPDARLSGKEREKGPHQRLPADTTKAQERTP